MRIRQRLDELRSRIAQAARRAGRDMAQVRLVAVTKGVATEQIQEAIACGVGDVGENRVQEAREKRLQIDSGYPSPCPSPPWGEGSRRELRWHLVGHLQSNKAKLAVELFDVIHSVDSLELVQLLERQVSQRRRGEREKGEKGPLEVLVQVNVAGEENKFGCRPEEAEGLAEAILRSEHLKWTGLMTMAPFSDNPEDSRPHFRKLRELRDYLQEKGFQSTIFNLQSTMHLSMGMSQDFEVAVEEGATMVRIGTAIFGQRN